MCSESFFDVVSGRIQGYINLVENARPWVRDLQIEGAS
jgi:hypothetical protein